jgi:N-methylhydantoinase B
MCERFGKDVLLDAYEVLLDRTHKAMSQLIQMMLPETPVSFEDYIDDDGRGNGPYKMKLTMWREGDQAFFDWTGTDPQAPGPINFFLNEEMFKMFIGVYLIMVFDPQILFNDGFYPLLHVTMPQGTLIQPNFPALTRLFDVLGGCLAVNAPDLMTAAGYGTSPYLLYNGNDEDGEFFHLMEITYGGIPGRPVGDGMDAHSWWPLFENIPTEYLESYYPMTIMEYGSLIDSGGAGFHRGGNAVRKVYRFDVDGEIAIHDDRDRSRPWGLLGGQPGEMSTKELIRVDGTRASLPSKISQVPVKAGDILVYHTAGGGGWKDPYERPAEVVQKDVRNSLVSRGKAESDYGVILDETTLEIDDKATGKLRAKLAKKRGGFDTFTIGPVPASIGVVAANQSDSGGNGGAKAKNSKPNAKKIAA